MFVYNRAMITHCKPRGSSNSNKNHKNESNSCVKAGQTAVAAAAATIQISPHAILLREIGRGRKRRQPCSCISQCHRRYAEGFRVQDRQLLLDSPLHLQLHLGWGFDRWCVYESIRVVMPCHVIIRVREGKENNTKYARCTCLRRHHPTPN